MQSLIASKKKMLAVIAKELTEIKDKYGDERRTKVIKGGVKAISVEDLIPEKNQFLCLHKVDM